MHQLHGIPLILVGPMWKELVAWAGRPMVGADRRLADPEDVEIPSCVDSVDDVL